jgi:hypothetical protein
VCVYVRACPYRGEWAGRGEGERPAR